MSNTCSTPSISSNQLTDQIRSVYSLQFTRVVWKVLIPAYQIIYTDSQLKDKIGVEAYENVMMSREQQIARYHDRYDQAQ